MIITQITNAALVWGVGTRSITSLGSAITFSQADNSSLANGSTAIFGGGAAANAETTVVGSALANVTWNLGIVAVATFRTGVTNASGTLIFGSGVGAHNLGFALANTGTVGGNYTAFSILWQ